MNPSDKKIQALKDKLTEYKKIIKNGETLDSTEDALELKVDGGRIWLYPKDDGTTVDLHFMRDDPDEPMNGTGQLTEHLTRQVGFPVHGKYEPYTPFYGGERITRRVNYEYFQDN